MPGGAWARRRRAKHKAMLVAQTLDFDRMRPVAAGVAPKPRRKTLKLQHIPDPGTVGVARGCWWWVTACPFRTQDFVRHSAGFRLNRDLLGFTVTTMYGDQAAFISAGGYHHHIGLNTWESRGGAAPAAGTTGLYHTAILYPARADLADAYRRVLAAGITLDGAADHGVSEALYLRDPDQNGIELYWDKPEAAWPRDAQGGLAMVNDRLDLVALAELGR